MRRIAPLVVLVIAIAAGCARLDGAAPGDGGDDGDGGLLAGVRCAADLDCGTGRYCSPDKVCAIDCVTSKDCVFMTADPGAPNTLACSPCGRCLRAGEKDQSCVLVSDTPCAGDDECVEKYGHKYLCGPRSMCVHKCATDDECRFQGRGWSCGPGNACARQCTWDLDCIQHGWHFVCDLPPGTDQRANAYVEKPLVRECVLREGGVDWGSNTDPQEPAYRWHGVWGWMLNGAARTFGLPLVNQQDTVSNQYMLVKITQDGGGVVFDQKWCGLEIIQFNESDTPMSPLAWMVTPNRYIDAIPIQRQRAYDVPALSPGSSFITDRLLEIRGAILANPGTDPLPSHHDLTGWWDQDRDGNPGVTTSMMGVLTGEIFNAIRWWVFYNVTAVDEDHLQGLLEHGTEQTVLGATSKALIQDTTVIKHPQADRSYFRAMRMADTASCNDLILEKKNAGSWLEFLPHYDPAKTP